jgi:hypothetical protein
VVCIVAPNAELQARQGARLAQSGWPRTNTPHEKLFSKALRWLGQHRPAGEKQILVDRTKQMLPICMDHFIHLEHVPEKLTDFSDQNMLQEIDFERILIDRTIPSDRNTL